MTVVPISLKNNLVLFLLDLTFNSLKHIRQIEKRLIVYYQYKKKAYYFFLPYSRGYSCTWEFSFLSLTFFARISDGRLILKKFVLQTFFLKFQQSKNFCMMLKLVGTKKLSDLLNPQVINLIGFKNEQKSRLLFFVVAT